MSSINESTLGPCLLREQQNQYLTKTSSCLQGDDSVISKEASLRDTTDVFPNNENDRLSHCFLIRLSKESAASPTESLRQPPNLLCH